MPHNILNFLQPLTALFRGAGDDDAECFPIHSRDPAQAPNAVLLDRFEWIAKNLHFSFRGCIGRIEYQGDLRLE